MSVAHVWVLLFHFRWRLLCFALPYIGGPSWATTSCYQGMYMKCCCCCCCLFSRDLSRGTISAKSRRDPISDSKNMFQQIILAPFLTSKDWIKMTLKLIYQRGTHQATCGTTWIECLRSFPPLPRQSSPSSILTQYTFIFLFVCVRVVLFWKDV